VEHLQSNLSLPTAVNVTVRRQRPREYLTEREIEKLMDAAHGNRWGHRDATAILNCLPAWFAGQRARDAALG
jgi:integrase